MRDLGSRNGILVNEVRVHRAVLDDADLVVIADASFRVQRLVPVMEPDLTLDFVDTVVGEHVCDVVGGEEQRGFRRQVLIADEVVLRRDYEKLRIAHELSLVLGIERDPERLLGRVLEFCFEVLPADHGVALLEREAGGTFERAAVRHRGPTPSPVLVSRTVLRRVQRRGEALLVEDTSEAGSIAGAPSIAMARIRSLLAVPLFVQDRVAGVLVLDSRSRERAFGSQDLHLVIGIAAQAALALERAELMRQNAREVEKRRFLSRFLSPALVEVVQAGRLEMATEARRQHLAVLFADMRGFTSFAERQGPERTVALLNELFERLEGEVFRYGDVVDKFVGDALMATWGYPLRGQDDAGAAVRCALAMQEAVAELGLQRQKRGLEPVGMGIGVHVGDAVVGCIGSERRMDFTSNGDAVNLTARLSGRAGPGKVIVSSEVAEALGPGFLLSDECRITVKGRSQPVRTFEVSGAEPAAD